MKPHKRSLKTTEPTSYDPLNPKSYIPILFSSILSGWGGAISADLVT